MWKYATSFKPLHMFLASELLKSLHVATFVSMPMKSSGLLHEVVRGPFSICKHILSLFWGWQRLFSKHAEAEQKIHHAYKKESVNWNFRFLQIKITRTFLSVFWYVLFYKNLTVLHNVNKWNVYFGISIKFTLSTIILSIKKR